MRTLKPLLYAIALVAISSCADSHSTAPAPTEMPSLRAAKGGGGGGGATKIKTVTVTPGSATISVGGTVQLTGVSKPAGFSLTWASSNSAVATVGSTGLVTGTAPGTATITASADGKSGTSIITVSGPSPAGATLLAAGDISTCTNDNDEATARLLDANPDGLVALLGDNVYDNGTIAEFTNCYHPTWGRHKGRTMPAPGNHEYNTPGGAGYYEYFGAAAHQSNGGYYSYDLGDWHIIALNSNVDRGASSAQIAWLRADLAASSGKLCTLAYWHHPRFSSGPHGNDATVQTFWDVLHEFNADVVLAGHDHHYERFAPQTGAGVADAARGIREFVVGTGGRSHYAFSTSRPNSQVFEGNTYGILKLTLSASSYSWQFLPIAGSTFTDTGTTSCH